MVLVVNQFNVRTGICHCNDHNFGHCYLHLIDRIDQLHCELYGVVLFPRHKNVLFFEPTDFQPIGIAPLMIEGTNFVRRGAPHKKLKGDLRFMSQRMGVECCPLPIGSKEERKLFSKFVNQVICEKGPTPTQWVQLAELFLIKCNFDTIFPKLPSMLVSYYNEWKQYRGQRRLLGQLGDRFDKFRERIAMPVTAKEMRGSTIHMGSQTSNAASEVETNDEQVSGIDDNNNGDQGGHGEQEDNSNNDGGNHNDEEVRRFVPTNPAGKVRCYYFPVCPYTQKECGGRNNKKECQYINIECNGVFPDDDELAEKKRDARNKMKQQRYATS